jgi:hypothetical protein
VTGSVTVQSSAVAVSGATVKLQGTTKSTTTNSSGKYTLSSVSVGTYTVQVSATGYQSATGTTTVTASGTSVCNFTLIPVITGAGNRIPWMGGSWYLSGADYPWYNYGTDFGTGGWGDITNWTSVSTAFTDMAQQGVRVARWWVFADGRYSPGFNSNGTVSGLDADVLADIDSALSIAAANKIYLILTVIDNSMWSAATTDNGVQMGGHAAIVTSSTVQQSFLNNALEPLLQHIAASPNHNVVLAYDIVNEPEGNMSAYWGGTDLSTSQVQSFVKQCVSYIHTYGGGAFATLGSASAAYIGTWKGMGLDFYQVHYYTWMDYSGAGSGLPAYSSLGLDKPCIVGEFPTVDSSYGDTDTTAYSANWYLNLIASRGYAGGLAWSYYATDSATSWASFQPVFTYWSSHSTLPLGP